MSNNSKNQKNSGRQQGKQIAIVCLVVCFVAALAIAGTYIFNRNDPMGSQASTEGTDASTSNSGVSDDSGQSSDDDAENGGNAQDAAASEASSDQILNEDESVEDADTESDSETEEKTEDSTTSSENDVAQQTSVAPQRELSLSWPVDGSVLMSYSMDKTVFFKTLNQYKYNPAMLIEGEVGDEVKSSASGTISSIVVDPQTGTTVTMNIGNGYAVVYGQLKEVTVQEGDYLDTGELIGYLSEPTKYYTEEGCNLYYQVLEDGNPVNPMDYLDSEQ